MQPLRHGKDRKRRVSTLPITPKPKTHTSLPQASSFIHPYPNTVISTEGALLRRSGEIPAFFPRLHDVSCTRKTPVALSTPHNNKAIKLLLAPCSATSELLVTRELQITSHKTTYRSLPRSNASEFASILGNDRLSVNIEYEEAD